MAEESAKKPKRRLRPAANTETVRERAERGQKGADKPKRTSKVRTLFKPLRPLAKPLSPVGRLCKKIGATKFGKVAGKILWPPYFRGAWAELRQVTWPNFRESIRLTSAVLIFAVIFGLIITATDYGLDKLFKKVLLKQ